MNLRERVFAEARRVVREFHLSQDGTYSIAYHCAAVALEAVGCLQCSPRGCADNPLPCRRCALIAELKGSDRDGI